MSPRGSAVRVRLGTVPTGPGVYLFRGAREEILYIGKARNLRRRVRSYFAAAAGPRSKAAAIARDAERLEILLVRSERAALLLEATLIRAHRPRYNRRMKDGGSYPFLGITVGPVPRVWLARSVAPEGAACFGPFPEAGAIRAALKEIGRLYTLRASVFDRGAESVRAALIDRGRMALEMLDLLTGRSRAVQDRIEEAMRGAAAALDFERAARLRNAHAAAELIAGAPRVHAGRDWKDEVVARTFVDLRTA